MTDWTTAPRAAYSERISRNKAQLADLDRQGSNIAHVRTVLFLGAAGVIAATIYGRLPGWGYWIAGVLLAFYGVAMIVHSRVIAKEERAKIRIALNERGLARLDGGWHKFPDRGDKYLDPEHLYAPDLDVFGQGSLFQLMNESGTALGERTLAAWLSAPASVREVEERQGAVKELTSAIDFRQELVVESRLVAREKPDPARFIRWAEQEHALEKLAWARPLPFVIPLITLAVFVLGQLGVIPATMVWLALLVAVLVIVATRKAIGAYYDALSSGEHGFVRFERAFAQMESRSFQHPYLRKLQGGLASDGQGKVSEILARFSRLYSFAELRHSQLHAVFNVLFLWDLLWLFRIEAWRKQYGGGLSKWFTALGELEALGCLATLAHDRPQFVFPEVLDSEPKLVAKGLGHPLLDAPVLNDIELPRGLFALLVTGSNMSGKTTLLRAMGANTVLALAGAPVCSQSYRVSRMQVLTSMRVKDSLERGVSYFYAEVRRLKALLDAATAAKGRALFLLDEILLGTNTRERQIASREVLIRLLETGASGGVTTHDLSLTTLADRKDVTIRNVHFEDHLEHGDMVFDYRLREGVVQTTNALRVLQKAGIQVSDVG